MPNPKPLNVLFLAAEAAPLVKVGGLGDVAGSLPRALNELSQSADFDQIDLDIRLVIPYHPTIKLEDKQPELVAEYEVKTISGAIPTKVFLINIDRLAVYLIGGAPIDNSLGVYSIDAEADGFKFIFFSLAALELPKYIGWKPDIYHCNDWHTAAAVYALSLRRENEQIYSAATSILTVHNLPYLGSMTSPALTEFGLPYAIDSDLPAWAQQMALPLGLFAADQIVAVSPGYAKEIMTDEFGSGLAGFLQANRAKISGILNGLDTTRWDPATDLALVKNFSLQTIPNREANKSFLQNELGLLVNRKIPLLAMITRMDHQKGVDLSIAAIREILQSVDILPLQVILLGTGDPSLEETARQLEVEFPAEVRALIKYDEHLSRQIYGGADALLMPSRYEPCGLSQMIAMRYGCVPIARATGGLSDTIADPRYSAVPTGFLFEKPDGEDLAKAIHRALHVYSEHPETWQQLCIHGMQQDFSWDRSAREYLLKYRLLSGC